MIQSPPTPPRVHVLVAGGRKQETLRRTLARAGHRAELVPYESLPDVIDSTHEAVIIAAPRAEALALCQRVKTRFQIPLLPVLVLLPRPGRLPEDPTAPDAWLASGTKGREVLDRVEELVRIRRAEAELVRLNTTLAELAAENGQLYDRARRDAEATTVLLRELQHRVRNNLASIQALLVLERHRTPARPLHEALDVAIGRLRSMAALQDSLTPSTGDIDLATLANAVARGALDVFGATGRVQCDVRGNAILPARIGSAIAITLNELITNALKHADARRVAVEIASQNGELKVCVTDDGRGMPAEWPAGSGLMIVRAVVKNELNGTLAVMPSAQGTQVCISLPSKADARVEASPGRRVGARAG